MGLRPLSKELKEQYVNRGYWKNKIVSDYVDKSAKLFPDRVAVIDEDRSATYKEIEEKSLRCAAGLYQLGVRRGDVVSFQLPNILEAFYIYHGIARLGAIANPIVPIYRGKELRFILNQAKSKVIFIPDFYRNHDYVSMYESITGQLSHSIKTIVIGDDIGHFTSFKTFMENDWENHVDFTSIGPQNADDLLLLLYTSGTTANPKGALHSHNTILYDAKYIMDWFRLNERDVIFNPSPITHITGILCALNMPFVLGGKVVLQDRWDPDHAVENIGKHHCSFMIFATPFLQGILSSPIRNKFDLSSLRYICCGGADMPSSMIDRASKELNCTVVRQYGATELPSATCTNLDDLPEKRSASDGRWMSPTEGRVVDDRGELCPAGTQGEIQWRGPDMFLGYLDQTLNEDSFTEDGWFKTGDLGYMDKEGYIYITGRIKDIINRGGEKISVKEIEDIIYEHPAIKEVVIVGMPDPTFVEKACAFVVVHEGQKFDWDEMIRYLGTYEIAKQKYPERLEIISELPKTASGKIQKYILRQQIKEIVGG
ncbi:AMP-binding protein [Neobacillus rhizophilus]|uniref:AMP-binding protein n=1 Tax=Neobacillus rhizophilus TaxID=2833579 RepID=A0A942YVD7_9BACI|nr:AMP-binding protein [Neobacillus rhizophilus]MBS4214963.1 AMP-binding protein [Neobacillus rhizophilus]